MRWNLLMLFLYFTILLKGLGMEWGLNNFFDGFGLKKPLPRYLFLLWLVGFLTMCEFDSSAKTSYARR
jgi:hypothetical protein